MSTTSVRTRPSPVLGLVLVAMVVLLAGMALVTPGTAQGEPAPATLPLPSATTVAPPPTTAVPRAVAGDPIPLTVIPEDGGTEATVSGGNGVVWPASDGTGVPSGETPAAASPEGTTSPSPRGGAESVIGPDGRTQVTDTTTAPSSRIGQINLVRGGVDYVCTGWLIDPNTILTAGICVNSGGGYGLIGTPTTSMSFSPGRNGGTNPFGTCNATALFTTYPWVIGGSQFAAGHNWGIAQLDCDIGDTVGWFGYRSMADDVLLNRPVTVRGYPVDQPSGTMWTMEDQIRSLAVHYGGIVGYRADTFGGQQGSPVYSATGCSGPCGLAVHSYGCAPCQPPNNFNSGPRLTAGLVDKIYEIAARNNDYPDAHVRRLSGAFTGNNQINLSGAGQTLTDLGVARGVTRRFAVRAQNDGTVTQDFTVRGTGTSPNYEVNWFLGTTNITSQVRAGTYLIDDLAAGANVDLRVEIKVKNTAPANTRVNVKTTVRASISPNYSDAVGTIVGR